MTKNRLIALICVLSILCSVVFTGCGSQNGGTVSNSESEATEPAVPIKVKEAIPAAYVDEAYDLTSLITEEEDVEYTFTASYVDPQSGETKELTVKRGKITPKVESDIQVSVKAVKGADSATVSFVVPIHISADAVDKLLCSDGAAGAADAGVVKTVVKDSAFLFNEASASSLEVIFSNPAASNDGTNILTLSHYSMLAYYSAQVWKNAAVVFQVYNPSAQDVEFKLSSYNPANYKTLLWDSADNTQVQVAKAGQWSQIVFSLYDMDIKQPLFTAMDGMRDDVLKVLARYAGTGECKIYVDCLDIVNADTVDGLQTGYVEAAVPNGDFSDLLSSCKVYTNEVTAKLSKSTNGNGTNTAYRFGADQKVGYPTFHLDFDKEIDISGFDYLKFDVYAEKCYPWVSVAIRYIDENGEVQKHGTSYDFYREQWRTIYLNLDYLTDADLTRVVGINFSVHVDNHFVDNAFNCVYFDNVSLYDYPLDQPQLEHATIEDSDLISGPMYAANIKPNTSGVCKVATDETGEARSNSTLLFWTNNACGYPNVYATFMFDQEQDWSGENVFSVDTHQYNAHYWMGFTLITLDEEGNEKTYFWRHDTVLTHWMTNSAPFSWFKDEDGNSAKAEDLTRVIGLKISVDLAVNVTDEVGYIFFDNIYAV